MLSYVSKALFHYISVIALALLLLYLARAEQEQ
jgi:hypothetical protein